MAHKGSGIRYAQASFEIARGKNELDRWLTDLRSVAAVATSSDLVNWLENPKIRFEIKREALSKQFSDVNPLVLNLVFLLVGRRKVALLPEIVKGYAGLLNEQRGVVEADVTTAVPLDAAEQKQLAEHLGTIVGKTLVLKPKVDPSIIGGFIARIGDKVLDGSTAGRLQALRRAMAR